MAQDDVFRNGDQEEPKPPDMGEDLSDIVSARAENSEEGIGVPDVSAYGTGLMFS